MIKQSVKVECPPFLPALGKHPRFGLETVGRVVVGRVVRVGKQPPTDGRFVVLFGPPIGQGRGRVGLPRRLGRLQIVPVSARVGKDAGLGDLEIVQLVGHRFEVGVLVSSPADSKLSLLTRISIGATR